MGSRQIRYWALDAPGEVKPLASQVEPLQEDLAQMAYGADMSGGGRVDFIPPCKPLSI